MYKCNMCNNTIKISFLLHNHKKNHTKKLGTEMVAFERQGLKAQASYKLCQTIPGKREDMGISREQGQAGAWLGYTGTVKRTIRDKQRQ